MRTEDHRGGVIHLTDDEAEADGVPVGHPDVVARGDDGVLREDGEGGDGAEREGRVPRRRVHGEHGRGDGDRDGAPGRDGGHAKGRAVEVEAEVVVEEARVRLREEVGRLRGLDGRALAARDAADNELRGLGDDADGIDVGGAGRVHADEGDEEHEEEREDANADVHVEGELADDERAAYREPEPERPSPDGDLFVRGRGIVERNVLFLAGICESAARPARRADQDWYSSLMERYTCLDERQKMGAEAAISANE